MPLVRLPDASLTAATSPNALTEHELLGTVAISWFRWDGRHIGKVRRWGSIPAQPDDPGQRRAWLLPHDLDDVFLNQIPEVNLRVEVAMESRVG